MAGLARHSKGRGVQTDAGDNLGMKEVYFPKARGVPRFIWNGIRGRMGGATDFW